MVCDIYETNIEKFRNNAKDSINNYSKMAEKMMESGEDSQWEAIRKANRDWSVGERLLEIVPETPKKLDRYKLAGYKSHAGWQYAYQQPSMAVSKIVEICNIQIPPMPLAEFFRTARPGMQVVSGDGPFSHDLSSGDGKPADCSALEEKVALLDRLLSDKDSIIRQQGAMIDRLTKEN